MGLPPRQLPVARGPDLAFELMVIDHDQRGETWCDCGRPKEVGKEACARCAYLDASPRFRMPDANGDSLVVATLRDEGYGGLTIYEIADRVGLCPDQVRRVVHRLESTGRVRSWVDGEGQNSHRRKTVGDDLGVGAKRYRLTAG